MTSESSSSDLSTNWAPKMPTVQEVSKSMQSFGTPDYTVFATMLLGCGIIGIYFGFVKKSSGEDEYLVGGRNMKTFPITLSLVASFISGIELFILQFISVASNYECSIIKFRIYILQYSIELVLLLVKFY